MKNLILVHLESVSELFLNINQNLFPNIENIMQESTYYRNYFSSATSTLIVMSDICYGGMFREYCTELENNSTVTGMQASLFDVLSSNGYHTRGIIWPKLTTYSKIVNGNILGRDMEIDTPKSYESFIKTIDQNIMKDEPFALFVGNFVSHVSYRNNQEIKGADSYTRWKQGYKSVDDTCGKIMDLLRKSKKENDTVVVFYGDHGDDFWGHRLHNGYTHAIEPYSNIIHTPLFIREPKGGKEINDELVSSMDLKSKILNILFDQQHEKNLAKREYIFSRNIFANQKIEIMTLSKGYSVATDEYILLVSPRGLELYNMCMDPVNTCNLLEFFSINAKGNIKFNSRLNKIRSGHFLNFFTDKEVRHISQIYKQLRKALLYETEKIYGIVQKNVEVRDKELNFYKINKYHFFNMYKKSFINMIEKLYLSR